MLANLRSELLDQAVIQAISDGLAERLLQAAVDRAVQRLQGTQEQRGGRVRRSDPLSRDGVSTSRAGGRP
jgi:hypothetical protein